LSAGTLQKAADIANSRKSGQLGTRLAVLADVLHCCFLPGVGVNCGCKPIQKPGVSFESEIAPGVVQVTKIQVQLYSATSQNQTMSPPDQGRVVGNQLVRKFFKFRPE